MADTMRALRRYVEKLIRDSERHYQSWLANDDKPDSIKPRPTKDTK